MSLVVLCENLKFRTRALAVARSIETRPRCPSGIQGDINVALLLTALRLLNQSQLKYDTM